MHCPSSDLYVHEASCYESTEHSFAHSKGDRRNLTQWIGDVVKRSVGRSVGRSLHTTQHNTRQPTHSSPPLPSMCVVCVVCSLRLTCSTFLSAVNVLDRFLDKKELANWERRYVDEDGTEIIPRIDPKDSPAIAVACLYVSAKFHVRLHVFWVEREGGGREGLLCTVCVRICVVTGCMCCIAGVHG